MLHPPDEDEESPRPGGALLRRATKQQILARMLLDLKRLYVRMRSFPQARDATELLLAVDPSAINELRDRGCWPTISMTSPPLCAICRPISSCRRAPAQATTPVMNRTPSGST
jgi:hypothetical protein